MDNGILAVLCTIAESYDNHPACGNTGIFIGEPLIWQLFKFKWPNCQIKTLSKFF